MISRSVTKTGLGRRIAFGFIKLLGNRSLGLAYALVATDTVLASIVPSNSARAGGIVFPIARSVAEAYESTPGPTRRRLGAFLMKAVYQADVVHRRHRSRHRVAVTRGVPDLPDLPTRGYADSTRHPARARRTVAHGADVPRRTHHAGGLRADRGLVDDDRLAPCSLHRGGTFRRCRPAAHQCACLGRRVPRARGDEPSWQDSAGKPPSLLGRMLKLMAISPGT